VFVGLLPICANSDGLAVVLGHGTLFRLPLRIVRDVVPVEIAHQVARHSAERMSQMKVR
jgi:hypothetical protein